MFLYKYGIVANLTHAIPARSIFHYRCLLRSMLRPPRSSPKTSRPPPRRPPFAPRPPRRRAEQATHRAQTHTRALPSAFPCHNTSRASSDQLVASWFSNLTPWTGKLVPLNCGHTGRCTCSAGGRGISVHEQPQPQYVTMDGNL